jgi:predicted HicB family RNase H-like nuclease
MSTKKVGRPTRDPSGQASKLFPVRLTDAEREEYGQAAERAGMSVSEWIRDRLAKAAKREAQKG